MMYVRGVTRGRQTREHCFKDCMAWQAEIRTPWKNVSQMEDSRAKGKRLGGRPSRGGKGFGYGPGNTTVRKLLSDEQYVGAVLEFLKTTRVGVTRRG